MLFVYDIGPMCGWQMLAGADVHTEHMCTHATAHGVLLPYVLLLLYVWGLCAPHTHCGFLLVLSVISLLC
jgi:hypothetical protein